MLWVAIAVHWDNHPLLVPAFLFWGTMNCALFTAPRRAMTNVVPMEKQGRTGGIAMTSQLLGGTIAIAICGALYSMTDDFRSVFLAAVVLTFGVPCLAWLASNLRDLSAARRKAGVTQAALALGAGI